MTTEQRLDSVERLLGAVASTLQTVAANHESAEKRLTRIEAIAEQNSTSIGRLEAQVAQTNTAIDQIEVQMAQTNTAIDRLEAQVAQTNTAIDRLEVQVANVVKGLEDSCTDLVRMIGVAVEEGERGRQLLTETANADRAEMRRILDYLFGQQSNGNGKNEGA